MGKLLNSLIYMNDYGLYPLKEQSSPKIEKKKYGNIEDERETFVWGSFGKEGIIGQFKLTILKNISDSHLLHVIGHLILTNRVDELLLMLEEAKYRTEHNIFVPDYE